MERRAALVRHTRVNHGFIAGNGIHLVLLPGVFGCLNPNIDMVVFLENITHTASQGL
jgi:hypothetical protein